MKNNRTYILPFVLLFAYIFISINIYADDSQDLYTNGDAEIKTSVRTNSDPNVEELIFFEDFGTSDKDVNYGRSEYPYMPTQSFKFGTPYPKSDNYYEYAIDNNHYAVVAPGYIKLGHYLDGGYYFWTPAYNEANTVTDMSGKENGAVLVINAGNTLLPFFQRDTSLESNETYKVSFWMYMVNGPSKVAIDIINKSTGEVLGSVFTPGSANDEDGKMGDWDPIYKNQWVQHSLYFSTHTITPECNLDEVFISIRNAHAAKQGNDYFIDDIKLEKVSFVPDGTITIECPSEPQDPLNTTNAVDDFYETGKNTSVRGNVLDNDFDLEGHNQTVSTTGTFATAKEGSVTINSDGTFTYTPPVGGFSDFDSFKYTVCDDGDPQACDEAEVVIAVGVCYEVAEGESYKWSDTNPNGAVVIGGTLSKTITQPAVNYGFVFDIYELDNSFNMEINGVMLAEQEIEFQYSPSNNLQQNIKFQDESIWGYESVDFIWNLEGDAQNPIIRVVIGPTGKVSMYGSKTSGGELYPLVLFNGNKFNVIPFKVDDNEENEITVTQNMVRTTKIEGTGYGANQIPCPNYWYGYDGSNEWADIENWTDNYVPENLQDIEFATEDNNSGAILGLSGKAAGLGTAKQDLHLDGAGRVIKDLINKSNKNLIVTLDNLLVVDGKVHEDNTGGVIVQADPEDIKAMGSLIFNNPGDNLNVAATVQFHNKACECADCGFYRKQWQYFGVPVKSATFPYSDVDGDETINMYVEPHNGDKWRPVSSALEAFKGYQINNSLNEAPQDVYNFDGILNVGDANVALTKTENVNYSGTNLVSNSYTAAIPISVDAMTFPAGVEETVYLFNTGTRDQWRKLNGTNIPGYKSGQYLSVPLNLGGTSNFPDRIPSTHAFMVLKSTAGDDNLIIDYSKLVKNSIVNKGDGTQITTRVMGSSNESKTSSVQQLPSLVIDVIGEESADRVWIFQKEGTSHNFNNGWDGRKMLEGDLIQVFATDDDHNKYQVTTVPQLDNTTLGIAARENESYTISVAVADDVEVRRLYLHDLFTGRGYLLKNGAEFVISGTRSANQNRFKITSSPIAEAQKGDDAPIINTYVRDNVIVVENRSGENAIVSIYDISGRFVGKAQIAKDEIKSFAELSVGTGVKVVKVVSNSGSINRSDRVLLK